MNIEARPCITINEVRRHLLIESGSGAEHRAVARSLEMSIVPDVAEIQRLITHGCLQEEAEWLSVFYVCTNLCFIYSHVSDILPTLLIKVSHCHLIMQLTCFGYSLLLNY